MVCRCLHECGSLESIRTQDYHQKARKQVRFRAYHLVRIVLMRRPEARFIFSAAGTRRQSAALPEPVIGCDH